MAAKVTFDTSIFEVVVTQTPDVNGFIDLDVQVDLFSDGKEDWLASANGGGDPALARFEFPIEAIGGVQTADGKQGTLYLLKAPWKLRLYDGDHELRINGVLRSNDGTRVWVPPVTPRTIAVTPLAPNDVVFLSPDDASTLAGAVWDELVDNHLIAGSAGVVLADARLQAARAFQIGASL